MRLKGKVALITGGGDGIGRACVELFAREGAKIVVAELDAASGEAACRDATEQGFPAIFVQTDVSRPEDVEQAVARAVQEFGGLDILYNNVGGSTLDDGTVVTAPFSEFRKKIDIDLFGTWLGAHYAVPEMIKRGGGSIVNATSICGLAGIPGKAAYSAAKGAISALTRSMAVDLAPSNIRVNAVAPGGTLTPRVTQRLGQNTTASKLSSRHLLGLAEPIDVAYAVLYLASDEARRTTGHILTVDSGLTIS